MNQKTGYIAHIFTDGSSLGNPGPGGWGAVLLFRDTVSEEDSYVYERGGGAEQTTNNRMELVAVIEALAFVAQYRRSFDETIIWTDSQYTISGITNWIENWERRGWKTKAGTDVKNKDLWRKLQNYTTHFEDHLRFEKVEGHVGVPGNERADAIANVYAANQVPDLYEGSLEEYPHGDLLQVEKKRSKQAYRYLSLVDGKLERHDSWESCRRRVSGKTGAQFRKALSAEHEQEILREWGV